MSRSPSRRLRWLLLLLVSVGLTACRSTKPPILTVVVFDIGQGDAILLQSQGKAALIDAGPPGCGILDSLRGRGVTALDMVVASHHHADHIGEMASVIQSLHPRFYLESGTSHTTRTYQRVLKAVRDTGTQFLQATPRTITLGAAKLRVFPLPPEDREEDNNNSVGLRVETGMFAMLLTGDSEGAERAWWRTHAAPMLLAPVTALKAAHHGSRNGTDRTWLRQLKPRWVVASLAAGNSYGHPHREFVDLITSSHIPLLRTDQVGSVTITTDGQTTQVTMSRGRGPLTQAGEYGSMGEYGSTSLVLFPPYTHTSIHPYFFW